MEIRYKTYNTQTKTLSPIQNISTIEHQIICESTGLFDCNDKEIFCGDIVEVIGQNLTNDSTYPTLFPINIGDRFAVKRLESGFTLLKYPETQSSNIPNLHTNCNNYNFWNGHRHLKIVGSVFNPENLADK